MNRNLTIGVIVSDPDFRDTIIARLQRMNVRIVFAVSDASVEASKIENTNPDVLILDFSNRGAHAVMAELKRIYQPPAVIGAHLAAEPDVILGALRAGAREFIYPPLNETALEQVLNSIATERATQEARSRAGKAIGFISANGGSGATLLASHVAAELRRITEGETLAADFDLSGGMVGFWLKANGSYSALDAAHNLNRLDVSFWQGLVTKVAPRLDVLNAPAVIPLAELPGPRRFADVLRFARANYPWIIADLGVGLNPISAGLLPDLDTIYVVSTPEVASLYQTRRIVRTIVQAGIRAEAVKTILSRVRKGQAVIASQDLQRVTGVALEMTLPDEPLEISDAQADNRLVSPRSNLGRHIAELAGRVAGKERVEVRAPRSSIFNFLAQEA